MNVVELLGDDMDLTCSVEEHPVIARVPARRGVRPGDSVLLRADPERLHYFRTGEFGESLLSSQPATASA